MCFCCEGYAFSRNQWKINIGLLLCLNTCQNLMRWARDAEIPLPQVTMVTKLCAVEPRILRWLLDFWKIFASLRYAICLWGRKELLIYADGETVAGFYSMLVKFSQFGSDVMCAVCSVLESLSINFASSLPGTIYWEIIKVVVLEFYCIHVPNLLWDTEVLQNK
jgi:hypothetical protein